MLRESGMEFFNPDDAAGRFRAANPGLAWDDANSLAWRLGAGMLERAIQEHASYAFETTLGGTTITALLKRAAAASRQVRIWYVGLSSVELHIARVKRRVALGGHDIPEAKIRERYSRSLLNLIDLIPTLYELAVFDNSAEGDPASGIEPRPVFLLHLRRGKIVAASPAAQTPHWAKPIVVAALRETP